MTIASEITRLQCAKSDIRQAIIDKWVDVPASDNIDCYACCINDIPTWWGGKIVDVMVVAWGWGGWNRVYYSFGVWGWGWAGWYIEECKHFISEDSYCIVVWAWWTPYQNWCNSCFWNEIVTLWWWKGWGWCWGSWWWASLCNMSDLSYCYIWWEACAVWWKLWWHDWGLTWYYCSASATCWMWWWWGWACWPWMSNIRYACTSYSGGSFPWYWWKWVFNNFAWVTRCYAWWGWGWSTDNSIRWYWCCWWWNGWVRWTVWCNATTYWSWWWWAWFSTSWDICWGCWCQWIVVVRYPTDWSYGINSAAGGNTCRTCTIDWVEYCIHEFTSNWTFCITG